MARNDSSSQRGGLDEPIRFQLGNKRVTIEQVSDSEPSGRVRANEFPEKDVVTEDHGGRKTPKVDGRRNNGRKKGTSNHKKRPTEEKAEK